MKLKQGRQRQAALSFDQSINLDKRPLEYARELLADRALAGTTKAEQGDRPPARQLVVLIGIEQVNDVDAEGLGQFVERRQRRIGLTRLNQRQQASRQAAHGRQLTHRQAHARSKHPDTTSEPSSQKRR